MTYLEDFISKYPQAPRSEDGTPRDVCPRNLGYTTDYCDEGECIECWSREIEETPRVKDYLKKHMISGIVNGRQITGTFDADWLDEPWHDADKELADIKAKLRDIISDSTVGGNK